MVLRDQSAAIPSHLPSEDAEENVEVSPECSRSAGGIFRAYSDNFKPQNCLHGVIPGSALSYNDFEGVKAKDNLVMRATVVDPDHAKRRRDEKEGDQTS